jgi:virginiamycin B lyase
MTTAGSFTEFPIPTANGRPEAIAAGPDGALWFTEIDANKIGRVTTDGNFTEFPIPTPNTAPLGIAAGPDRALWFIEFNANKIGRISVPIPTSKDECKSAGWRAFGFKNQGQCVAFVERGPKP